jgi:zinc protease
MLHPSITRTSHWLLALALAAGSLATGCATGGLPDKPELKPYDQAQWVAPLKSGLRVIVQEDHSAPLVTVVATYGTGATSDPKGVEGLAHFVEHLVFRSKPGGGQQQYWDHLKRMGALTFNAFTSHDVTSYYVVAHKDNLHEIMQLEAWRMARTLDGVTPEVFKTEREVVRSELRQRWETTAGSRMFDLVFESLFPTGHPLVRSVGGSHQSLTNATLDHAKAFVKEHYTPNNCTIVITGDVKTDEVKRLLGMWPAEVLFGPGGPEGEAVPPRKRLGERAVREVPPPVNKTLRREKGPVAEPMLVLGWSAPGAYRDNDALLSFIGTRLNLALQAGLDLKEEDEILDYGAFPIPGAEGSVIIIVAELEPDADPEKIRRRILDVLVHSWSTDTGDLQIEGGQLDWKKLQTEAVRWSAATGLLLMADDPIGKATGLSEYMTATGRSSFFKSQFEELAALKSTQISEFAYKWVNRDRAVAVYIEPDMTEAARLVGGGGGGGAATPRTQHEVGGDITLDTQNLTSERLLKLVKSPQLGQLPRQKLANGLEIYTIARESAPVARVMMGIRGGDASVKPLGLASLASAWARTKCRNTEGLEPVGGWIFRGTSLNASSVQLAVPSGNLANGLAVLGDEVNCLEVDDEQFLRLGRMVEKVSKRYKRRAKRPEFIAGKRLSEELYAGHPFGEWGFEDPERLGKVRREDAQAFVSGHFRPENALAVVYGDVTPKEVNALAEKYLTAWRGGAGASSSAPPPLPPSPSRRKIFLVDRPKATQALIAVGCRLVDVVPDKVPAYDVLETVATEQAEALREQWGATYGVYGSVSTYAGGGADLTMGGAVDNAQAAKALVRMLEITTGIATGRVPEPLFLISRWDVGRSFMSRMASPEMMAASLSMSHTKGWPMDTWDKYPENLAQVTRESIQQLMKPCLAKEVVTIVGDATVLRQQLVDAGLKLEDH